VQFSTPLPLAQSGLAVYGFRGMFVMNGARALDTSDPDPVGRELDWYELPPEHKFDPRHEQYALGVGAVVGTMPDASFCFSAEGMLVVAFPDPAVVFAIAINLVSVPDTEAKDEGDVSSATILGLIVIDPEGVKVGAKATYTIPKVLVLDVPFAAAFPFDDLTRSYVRLGSDGGPGRPGEPITATLLPGTLDVTAWSYLMIEGAGIEALGGREEFTFNGFSVGFGAGWSIEWKAGPIELTASAEVLVGLGTNPLLMVGGVFVRGKLDLVVVSIAASGSLVFSVQEEEVRLEGEFCGEVDLFLFSLSGCVGISIGNPPAPPAEPPSPLAGINLTDGRDRIMGVARAGGGSLAGKPIVPLDDPTGGVDPSGNNTVWPDTAPALIFLHDVEEAIASSQFSAVGNPPANGSPWSGTSELKYAFRLDDVVLRRAVDDTPVTGDGITAVWMASPHRPADASGTEVAPSEHDGPTLKLLHWDPYGWVVNLDRAEGSTGLPGDPAREVGQLCEELPAPAAACRLGEDARRRGLHQMRLPVLPPIRTPYPSWFVVDGRAFDEVAGATVTGRGLQSTVAAAGGLLATGAVVDLPLTVDTPSGPVTRGYQLPLATFSLPDGLVSVHPPYELDLDRAVADPSVTLVVCDADSQSDVAQDDPVWGSGGPWGGINPLPGDGYLPGWPGWGGWPHEPSEERCLAFDRVTIGDSARALTLGSVRVGAISPGEEVATVDRVDTRGSVDTLGTDGIAEVAVPKSGMLIQLPRDCRHVTIGLAAGKGEEVTLLARSSSGIEVDVVTTDVRQPVVVDLFGGRNGIRTIEVVADGASTVVYELCCGPAEPPPQTPGCVTFDRQGPLGDRVAEVREDGWTLVPVDPTATIRFVDKVNELADPPSAAADGLTDLLFPSDGLRILPPTLCTSISVHVMAFSSDPITAVARDRHGNTVDQAAADGTQRVGTELVLTWPAGIAEVVLTGASGEGVLYKVCCHGPAPASRCVDMDALVLEGPTATSRTGVKLSARDGSELRLTDVVDARPGRSVVGKDGVPELVVPAGGLTLSLPEACDQLVLELHAEGAATVIVTVTQADGTVVAPLKVPVDAGQVFSLGMPTDDVVEVVLEVDGGPVHLVGICCDAVGKPPESDPKPQPTPEPGPEPEPEPEPGPKPGPEQPPGEVAQRCVDFAGFDRLEPFRALTWEGLVLRVPDDVGEELVADRVRRTTVITFGKHGIAIDLDGCDAVRITVVNGGSTPLVIDARSSKDELLDSEQVPSGPRPVTVTLTGPNIAVVEITGGGGALVEICCLTLVKRRGLGDRRELRRLEPSTDLERPGAPVVATELRRPRTRIARRRGADIRRIVPTGIATGAARNASPVPIDAIGETTGGAIAAWDAEVLDETVVDGRRCRVVRLAPTPGSTGPWEGVDLFVRHGSIVTLVAVCGVDQAALDARDRDQEARDTTRDSIAEQATTPPDERRPLALEPGTEYEIEVRWSWQAWQATDDDDTPPAGTDPAAWTPARKAETFRFQTASPTTTAPATPDALNEHVFDAADVGRYLIAVEPADGRSHHLLDDPIWVHFEVDHLEALLDAYGHELTIEVRRTDPPPQRSEADLAGLLAPRVHATAWFAGARQYQATATTQLNDAVLAAPCLPDGAPFGGASAAITVEGLAPDADYDLLVLATGGLGGDRTVHATRFHTSRYATADELLAAAGFGADGGSPPDELVLTDDHVVAGGDLLVGDVALDTALRDLGADTLPLPDGRARTYVLWRNGPGGWVVAAAIVDSLEPLHRERTVVGADGIPDLAERAVIDHLAIGTDRLEPVRANSTWTRVLFAPSAPIRPTGSELIAVLRTSDGDVVGRRAQPTQPLLLEREGLL
jgi:hypothetical protein